MDQNYSLFALIFKGVHEPFAFDSLLSSIFLRWFHECFAFHTGWSILMAPETLIKQAYNDFLGYDRYDITCGDHALSFKTKHYAKYDFSGFDNYTPSSMKIGELSHRIFSFIKTGHRDIAMSPP